MSSQSKNSTDTVQFLDISVLQPNPYQPRNKILAEDLAELANSIKRHGILEPLVIANTPAGYQIIAGERRWRAAKIAGLSEVPVLVKKATRSEMLEMALIENVQRTDLSPLERAHSFQQLMREFAMDTQTIAERISKSTSYISNTLKLLELPDAIKDGLIGGEISEGHARAISGIKDPAIMVRAYKLILHEDANVRRAEEIARRFKVRFGQVAPITQKKVYDVHDAYIKHWQKALTEKMATDSALKVSRSNTQTTITITLKGPVEKTQADLEKIIKWTGGKTHK